MNKWINAHIVKSEDLGEATEKEIDTYAELELNNITEYLHEQYPDAKITVDHNTNGLNHSVSTSDDYNAAEILDELINLIETEFQNWLDDLEEKLNQE